MGGVNDGGVLVDNRPVAYRRVSAGAPSHVDRALALPLLLLHGLGCSSAAWAPTLRALQQQGLGQPVFAPDLPGYGASPGPETALGIDALADWAARFLDALGVARVCVAAHSMGCQVALALARRHPDRAGRVVLGG
ncbi:MAG: hypothetical protein C4321_08700, partial [Chloroflexota bacterium]